MSDAHFLLTLGKLIIAAAWVDGQVAHEEINYLKDLLFRLPGLTGREWTSLEMYIESPVGADERNRLLEQLASAMRSPADKRLALQALQELAHADGVLTAEEDAIIGEMTEQIGRTGVNIFSQLGRLVQGAVERRERAMAEAPNREEHLEDFLKNKVYYGIQRRLEQGAEPPNIPESRLRKLSLAGGLMARVAHVDRQVTEEEFEAIAQFLTDGWGLEADEAHFVTEVAISEIGPLLDYYRLTRQFFQSTSIAERIAFARVLFAVAAADGFVTSDEIEEIRRIALGLRLTHRQFINAKLTIARDQRAS